VARSRNQVLDPMGRDRLAAQQQRGVGLSTDHLTLTGSRDRASSEQTDSKGSRLSLRTCSATSPLNSCEPGQQPGPASTRPRTWACRSSCRQPDIVGLGRPCSGEALVIFRPSRSASPACISPHANCPASSLKNGPDQSPRLFKTPSNDRYSVATTLMFASTRCRYDDK
jgi:hypothetical protein